MAILINTNREGYETNQVKSTMTAGELIELLKGYDEDTPIFLGFDNRYTYGGIKEYEIEEID